jgi:hypothetical protein
VLRRLPSAATASPRRAPFGARGARRIALVPESRDSVPAHANALFALPSSPVQGRARRPTGKLGAGRCKRDWGEPRFTARFSLRRSGDSDAGAFSSLARESIPLASGTFVASSVPRTLSPPFGESQPRGYEGRQDRFRGGLVKGVRFSDPRCLPPSVATRTPLMPKHERNREAFTPARRSRDEDRRTWIEPSPFCRPRSPSLAREEAADGQAPVHAPRVHR